VRAVVDGDRERELRRLQRGDAIAHPDVRRGLRMGRVGGLGHLLRFDRVHVGSERVADAELRALRERIAGARAHV